MLERIKNMPLEGAIFAFTRIALGLLWLENAGWKSPASDFGNGSGEGLYKYTQFGSTKPVLGIWKALVDNVILPNFTFFGWVTLITEASIAAFLIFGLATRLFALVSAGMTVTIAMTTLNAPNEWPWSYYLMFLVSIMVFATCAGRYFGLDGVLRPRWEKQKGRLSKLLVGAS